MIKASSYHVKPCIEKGNANTGLPKAVVLKLFGLWAPLQLIKFTEELPKSF